MIQILKSKIHRATVTESNLEYNGSITLSQEYLKLAKIREFEKVLVVDINNGNRFETYVIKTTKKKVICLNGAAARLVSVGDKVIIMSFEFVQSDESDNYKPNVVLLDENNEVVKSESF